MSRTVTILLDLPQPTHFYTETRPLALFSFTSLIIAEEMSGMKGAYQSTFLADLQSDSDYEEETFLQPGENIA